jgi:hypothetical protein
MSKKTICITTISEKTGLDEAEVAVLADEALEAVRMGESRDTFLKRKQEATKAEIQDQIFNLRKQTELEADIRRRIDGGADEQAAILESLESSERGGEGAKVDLGSDRDTIHATLSSKFFKELHDVDPDWHTTIRKMSDDNQLKLRQYLEDGKASGDKRIDAFGKAIRGVLDATHTRAHKAGIFMRRIKNYLPQNWDAKRVADFGKENWVKKMKSHLDLNDTFQGLGSEQIDEVLGRSWENIAHGRDIEIDVVGSPEVKRSSKNARHRVFKFKDAAHSMSATRAFGRKNSSLLTGVFNYIDGMSKDIAIVERLGTTPQENLQRVAVKLHNSATNAKVKKGLSDFIHDPANSKIGKAFDYGIGVADIPSNLKAAHINRSIRAALNMSKLGKAMLASIVDLGTAAHNLRFQGLGMFEAYGRLFKMLGEAATSRAEARQFNHHLAVGMDGVMASMQKWTLGDDITRPSAGIHSLVSRMETGFFRWSGLNWWTDNIRRAASRVTAEHLGSHATRGWSRLDPKVKRLLKLYDIDSGKWDKMRKGWKAAGGAEKLSDGRVYMLPEHLRESGLDETLMRIYQGEADYAVLMPNSKTRRLLIQGHRPGTIIGEALRYMAQFRSFPASISQKLIGRGWKQDKAGLALLIAQMWGWGYVAMTAKDLALGKKPKSRWKPQTYYEAFIHGGAVGIYGDLLLGSMVHRGGSPLDAIAGPGASEVVRLAKTLRGIPSNLKKGRGERSLARLGKQVFENLPYTNHFLAQGLAHYLILNHLVEMQNPGGLRRRQRRMEEEYEQEYLIKPHQLP